MRPPSSVLIFCDTRKQELGETGEIHERGERFDEK